MLYHQKRKKKIQTAKQQEQRYHCDHFIFQNLPCEPFKQLPHSIIKAIAALFRKSKVAFSCLAFYSFIPETLSSLTTNLSSSFSRTHRASSSCSFIFSGPSSTLFVRHFTPAFILSVTPILLLCEVI